MVRSAAALVVALACLACEPPPRGQVLLYLETDLPIPRLADTLRIEVLDAAGQVKEARTDVVADRQDWPVSFGVAATAGRARLRIRLFPATRISTEEVASGDGGSSTAGEPLPGTAVDRIVEFAPPDVGVERAVVLLAGECLGVRADAVAGTGCVPGRGFAAPASDGITYLAGPPDGARDLLGTWAELRDVPCGGAPRPDSALHDGDVCVPGGVFFLGDLTVGDVARAQCGVECAAAPERLVRMSPLYVDRWEVTVGRWRAALEHGFEPPADSWAEQGPGKDECIYTANADPDLAMNCIDVRAATAFCAWDGGRHLIREAEWEYTASGRGEERLYPWGDQPPDCQRAVYARIYSTMPVRGNAAECSPDTPPSAKALPRRVDEESGDQSRDGVRGLAGNVSEWTADEEAPYDAACWSAPGLRDPVCTSGFKAGNTYRGANWADAAGALGVALRGRQGKPTGQFNHFLGFRCARRGTP